MRSAPGYHTTNFDGSRLSSGMYIYQIEAESVTGATRFEAIRKFMLIKQIIQNISMEKGWFRTNSYCIAL